VVPGSRLTPGFGKAGSELHIALAARLETSCEPLSSDKRTSLKEVTNLPSRSETVARSW
jgi:hypothetical protein